MCVVLSPIFMLSLTRCILMALITHSTSQVFGISGTDQLCFKEWEYIDGCRICRGNSTKVICEGLNITGIPNNLPLTTTHLKLTKTGLVNITADPTTYLQSRLYKYLNLRYLSFDNNRNLQSFTTGALNFPAWKGNLSHIYIKGSPKLKHIQHGVLGNFRVLKSIHITDCGLTEPPGLALFHPGRALIELNLARNHINVLKSNAFSSLNTEVAKLVLESNDLHQIEGKVFSQSKISNIQLRNNARLTQIAQDAFADIKYLQFLDLSNTGIKQLPTEGLTSLTNLTVENTYSLREFPSVLQLPSMKWAKLTYPHHCCAFAHPERQNESLWEEFEKSVRNCKSSTTTHEVITTSTTTTPSSGGGSWGSSQYHLEELADTGQFPAMNSLIRRYRALVNSKQGDPWQSGVKIASRDAKSGKWDTSTINPNKNYSFTINCGIVAKIKATECTPHPDAFNPCEDVMGLTYLRISAWIVISFALVGNLVVLFVTLCSSFNMTVHKFLMCNLSLADFLLGCYLLFLSIIDVRTIGIYFTKAIPWQYGGGCQMAGFVAIFASNLSISTLVIITIERWYAITHAIDLTKRLTLRDSLIIMICFWIYSLLMATLPLIGVSSYSQTSICLPMQADSIIDKSYIAVLLIFNSLGFILICCCYIDMYRQVRGNRNTAGRNEDANIAKKMAVLVFTDFICLFPIALFGLTAAAGKPLITVSDSKILLVFFFPINSCCNPFLYAIFTKQFKKDMFGLFLRWGICEEKAAKYRYNYSSNRMSVSQSRNSISGNLNHIVKSSSSGVIMYNRCATKDKLNDTAYTGSTTSTRNSTPVQTPFNSMRNSPHCTPPPLKYHIPMESVNQLHNDVVRKLSIVREVSKVSSYDSDDDYYLNNDKNIRSNLQVEGLPLVGQNNC